MRAVPGVIGGMLCALALSLPAGAALPAFDHVVVVIEENHTDTEIIGNPEAPYINFLATTGALFTNSFAIEHPSQPNYLDLFSGSNQGITDNNTPPDLFTTPNLGAALIAKGLSFDGYADGLPAIGDTSDGDSVYARKHNPWVNWQDSTANAIPLSANKPFTDFPTDFSQLATVSFVVPGLPNDMHDGAIAEGDTWLFTNLDAYVQWAKLNNSLLILTWDEDDMGDTNHIPTVFAGANVIAGSYDEMIDHFTVLRTIEDIYGLDHSGASIDATPITDVFPVPEPSEWALLGVAMAALALFRRRRMAAPPYLSAK